MRRIAGCFLSAVLLLLLWVSLSRAEGDGVVKRRALLVGCDYFLSQVSTWPSAAGNIRLLASALQGDARGYAVIHTEHDSIYEKEMLSEAIRSTFNGMDDDDVSFFYISTHGLFVDAGNGPEAALLLSDGKREDTITAGALAAAYQGVPGIKVLVLDACNSGAFIGKGSWDTQINNVFSGPDWKVLASSGGSEKSFYWQSADKSAETLRGGSYFASTLADGIGYMGPYSADTDGDEEITLSEIFAYLTENYAASTPCSYPQDDRDFIFFHINSQKKPVLQRAVTDIVFDDTVLTAGEDKAEFSFTVTRRVRMAYQLVYFRSGAWQFENAQIVEESETEDGFVEPGRKMKALQLAVDGDEVYGYVLVQIITIEEDAAMLEGSRLLCVQPLKGDPGLAVSTGSSFAPESGGELALLVQHAYPCSMTVRILDVTGIEVRRLCYMLPTRPQQLSVEGSMLYWDGKTSSGTIAPGGAYTAFAVVKVGVESWSAVSAPFILE